MSDPDKTPTDPAPSPLPTNSDIMHALSGLVERFDGFETAVVGLRKTVARVADAQSDTRSKLDEFMREMRSDIREVKGDIVTIGRRVEAMEQRVDKIDGDGSQRTNGSTQ